MGGSGSSSLGTTTLPEYMREIHADWLGNAGEMGAADDPVTIDLTAAMDTLMVADSPYKEYSYTDPATRISSMASAVSLLLAEKDSLSEIQTNWDAVFNKAMTEVANELDTDLATIQGLTATEWEDLDDQARIQLATLLNDTHINTVLAFFETWSNIYTAVKTKADADITDRSVNVTDRSGEVTDRTGDVTEQSSTDRSGDIVDRSAEVMEQSTDDRKGDTSDRSGDITEQISIDRSKDLVDRSVEITEQSSTDRKGDTTDRSGDSVDRSGQALDRSKDITDRSENTVDNSPLVLAEIDKFSSVYTDILSKINALIAISNYEVSDADIVTLKSAFEGTIKPDYEKTLSEFAGGMAALNSINSSAYMIGMSMIMRGRDRDLANFEADLRKGNIENKIKFQQDRLKYVDLFSRVYSSIDIGRATQLNLSKSSYETNRKDLMATFESIEAMLMSSHEVNKKDLLASYETLKQGLMISFEGNEKDLMSGYEGNTKDLLIAHQANKMQSVASFERNKKDLITSHEVNRKDLLVAHQVNKAQLMASFEGIEATLMSGYEVNKKDLLTAHQANRARLLGLFEGNKKDLMVSYEGNEKDLLAAHQANKTQLLASFETEKSRSMTAYEIAKAGLMVSYETLYSGFIQDLSKTYAIIDAGKAQVGSTLQSSYEDRRVRYVSDALRGMIHMLVSQAQLRWQLVGQGTGTMISQYMASKDIMSKYATMNIEQNRMAQVMDTEYEERELHLAVKDDLWDLTIFKYGGDVLSAIGSSGASYIPDGSSPIGQALGGALSGAAAGALAGGAIGAAGGPIGAGAGALLGGLLGGVGGYLQ